MARNRKQQPAILTADSIFRSLSTQLGHIPDYTVADWDPDMQRFGQAILEILASGSVVFMRPGTGGQSFGVAIWEGDERHPAKWLHEQEHVDAWAHAVLELLGKNRLGTGELAAD
jgi:hypothetical protein